MSLWPGEVPADLLARLIAAESYHKRNGRKPLSGSSRPCKRILARPASLERATFRSAIRNRQEVTPTYKWCLATACKERHWAAPVTAPGSIRLHMGVGKMLLEREARSFDTSLLVAQGV